MNLPISNYQWNTGIGLDWAEDSQSPRLILHRWKLLQNHLTPISAGNNRTPASENNFFFPNFLFSFLLLFWGWELLCHIHYMHHKEMKTAFWQRVSSVFHGFNSASELRLTGIRVPGHLPSIINFSVSNVIIPFVSILENYDSQSFFYNLSCWSSQNKFLYDSRLVRKVLFSFSVLWVLHISGWWR